MARQGGVAVENNFTKGLITETTPLKFPPNACTETYDCVFDPNGRVTRRLGFDLESSYTLQTVDIHDVDIYKEYLWEAVAGTGTINFLVVQQGHNLFFYDLSSSLTISDNKKTFTVDLHDHLPTNADRDPGGFFCDFASGDGRLIVVNEATNPFYVEYSLVEDTITSTSIVLKFRDFVGVDDGLDLTTRSTESVASLKTNNPEHYYNLLNQGWHATDALAQWDTARTDMPSNVDYVALYRASETDAFDNARVTSQGAGNSPAAKGHFILEVGNEDRNAAMVADGFTGATIPEDTPMIAAATGTVLVGNCVSGSQSFAFDGSTNVAQGSCAAVNNASNIWTGKNYSSSPVQISSAIIFGSNDVGYDQDSDTSMTADMYAKTGSTPSAFNDGTIIGTLAFNETSNESTGRVILSTDEITVWDYVWIVVRRTDGNNFRDLRIGEIQFFAPDPNFVPYRPDHVVFFAGRAWYGGIRTSGLGNNIYFSQIIEQPEQYEKCYQTNDPTVEDNSQLLPSDGGVIKIPEMGTLTQLFATQNALLVFATNGVWRIAGGSGAAFTASDFNISRLSNIGTNSPQSFVDVRGIPIWWADKDIYTIQYDANYDSYKVTPTTTETISSFVSAIPATNRKYVKGTYNPEDYCVYWLYNTDESLAETDHAVYSNVLVLDTTSGAFYPWTIGAGDPRVRGVFTAIDASGALSAVVKYVTTISINATQDYLTFSETWQDSYKDWTDYAAFSGVAADEIDYTSYFISGYRLDGQANRKFQSNYIFFYMDLVADSSAYMQSIWDFTNANGSGRWSTLQQIYDSTATLTDVSLTRRKVRGHGKSLQLRVQSDSGKPFSIIGWVIWETSNASI